ncbi:uncharacterized protein N7506_008158 [Penicillium brevicompactum]|uniref:uncharacterized protein n=1 Tax=Penicillium brevicompactum TaxID=5074 RepID=UPI00253F8F1F|nr:uncharacterized protein N7506_008158 [Penicillium brevicompactum]KAJ5334375.1 hypothetical protein N7506_008158 [Penicillium brevicompactum]
MPFAAGNEHEAIAPSGTQDSSVKRHAACDECRKRKLKCSGELTGCSRCMKQDLGCNYSIQKQMGRPPKKRTRADDDGPDLTSQPEAAIWPSPEDSQQSSIEASPGVTHFPDSDHLCPSFFWPPSMNMKSPHSQPERDPVDLLSGYEDHNHSWRPERLKQQNLPVPASTSPWPDFSTVSEATAIPAAFPNPTSFPAMGSLPLSPSNSISSESTAAGCTCLSYLYLCLSHMSSISSFPVTSHTICSLYIAARAAQDVIRCQICPKVFATGIQNITFVGTLLSVVADSWLRVSKADAVELGMNAAPTDYVNKVLQSSDPTQAWKSWLHQVVRRAVIGGPMESGAAAVCSDHLDLLSIIMEIENRQRRWHQPGQHPFESSNSMAPSPPDQPHTEHENDGKEDYLCVRIVGSARAVIAKFNFDASDYPEGVEPLTPHNKPAVG